MDDDGNEVFYVVDGQQRLTTVVLFLNALRHTRPHLLNQRAIRTYLFDADDRTYKFQTVQEDWPFFRALLDKGEPASTLPPAETPSQKRLQDADEYFRKEFAQQEETELQRWLHTLSNSTVLVHAVDGYGEASVIFETVNDRGKRLTDLESLKSFLMHIIGQTRSSPQAEQQAIDSLQSNFNAIYRMINRFERRLDEDAALRQCYFLFSRPLGMGLYPYWNGRMTRFPRKRVCGSHCRSSTPAPEAVVASGHRKSRTGHSPCPLGRFNPLRRKGIEVEKER